MDGATVDHKPNHEDAAVFGANLVESSTTCVSERGAYRGVS